MSRGIMALKQPVARWLLSCLTALVIGSATQSALAHQAGVSDASALSVLPVAISVVAPVMVLSSGVMLTAIAVEASAQGTVWVLERASDGARLSVTLGSAAAGGLSLGVGTVVTASAIGAGWLLSAAGQVIAFIPNEIGQALLYNEQVTR